MFFLAIRYLFARRVQIFLVILGAVIGTAGYVAVSAIVGGFEIYVTERLISSDAHLRVQPGEQVVSSETLKFLYPDPDTYVFWARPPTGRRLNPYIKFPERWYDRLQAMPKVVAFTPQLVTQANARNSNVIKPVQIIGTDPEKQIQVTNIEEFMVQGQFVDLEKGGDSLILGVNLMQELGATFGDTIQMINEGGQSYFMRIVGVFQTGVRKVDERVVYMSLAQAQTVSGRPNVITDIAIRLDDPKDAEKFENRLRQLYSENFQTWEDLNANTLSVLTMQNIVGRIMIVGIIIVVCFGLYNVLQMLISQKRKEIAMLRAMGFEPIQIVQLFLYYGATLGALGGGLGLLLGLLISHQLQLIRVPAISVAVGGHLAISFAPEIYIIGFLITFIACTLSSLFPALHARKLEPVEIIRTV